MTASPTARWFFTLGRLEGASFLTLLCVGMPLKYLAQLPEPNLWIGWIHGFLFLAYLIALDSTGRVEGWPRTWQVLGFAAAVLPAGTFIFEKWIASRRPPR